MKLKKGDKVKIIKGKDKGKSGKIERIYLDEGKVLVEGINEFKRHLKGKSKEQPSQILTINKPLSVSSVALICSKCNKTTRVGIKITKDKKERICKKCKEVIG